VREGYFRQLPNGMIVFQLRGLREEVYMSLQGPDRYTPGLTLRITLAALRGLKEAFNARASTVVWSIAGNAAQQLIFAVELVALDETTGECELQLTATAEDYMLLATAIRDMQLHGNRIKQGTATVTIDFGAAGLLLFSVPFKWRSLATCKKMSEGVYPLSL
jgi:hypothetical protein